MSEKEIHLIDYLPAIFRETPFLEEFLRPFERVIRDFREQIAAIPSYCDPITADADFLPWLATWVALVLDEQWPEEKKRLLISKAMGLYQGRGTVESLKEYLEIYTGTEKKDITIRECSWPAGMQIGVASAIGGFIPSGEPFAEFSAEREPLAFYDYYVVRETDPVEGEVRQTYYRTDLVRKVDIDRAAGSVTIYYIHPNPDVCAVHHNATIARRDGLAETHYRIKGTPVGEGDTVCADYAGDTVLIREEAETPYRFIVDIKVAPNQEIQVGKIEAILDLEKPAYTLYYLRLVQERIEREIKPMQIAQYSSIGVDNYVAERNCYE
jgi:phage tail-like protein